MIEGRERVSVVFQPSGRRGLVSPGTTVLDAARRLGVGIASVCGNHATCGKCIVKPEVHSLEVAWEGGVGPLSPVSDAEVRLFTSHQRRQGYRLACQARIMGDVVISVPSRSGHVGHLTRKTLRSASAVQAKPLVKNYSTEISRPKFGEAAGDWERLQAALDRDFGLAGLGIDLKVLPSLQKLACDSRCLNITVWGGKEVIRVDVGASYRIYGLAIDVGTTTLAAYVCDLTTGEIVAADAQLNPQVVYGEDLASRMAFAADSHGTRRLNRVLIKGINELAGRVAASAGIRRQDLIDVTIVGNTCMHHTYLNLDLASLSKAPFVPAMQHSVTVKAREIGLKVSPGAYVHALPVIAGFVGSDTSAMVIAQNPHRQEEMTLLIDIGTNGELVLGNRERLVCASCAAGPALEGARIRYGVRAAVGAIEGVKIDPNSKEVSYKVIGKPEWYSGPTQSGAIGICGSGIIDATAQLLLAGVIDNTGRFKKDLEAARLRKGKWGQEFVIALASETSIGEDIVICQSDVRNVQLAKGALYAGAMILMRRLGVKKLDRVVLAGAFGSYINRESAAVLGLFPHCGQESVIAVGNAAGDGACLALINEDKRSEADWIAKLVEHVELAVEPRFQDQFCEAMWFPVKTAVGDEKIPIG